MISIWRNEILAAEHTVALSADVMNARDAIIKYCSDGSIIIKDNGLTIPTVNGNDISVMMNGRKFTDIDTLNKYINNRMGLW